MGHFLTRLGVYTANPFAFRVSLATGHFGMCSSRKLSSGTQWPPWQLGA